MMMPRSSAYAAPNSYSSSATSRTFSAISLPIRSTVLSNEMFSSWSPIAALVDGVKMGSRQPARLDEALRQLDAAHRAGLLVVLAPRAGEVAAHDRLHRQRLGLVHHDRAAGEVLALRVRAERVGVDEVVGDDAVGLLEPEVGDLREHDALVRDRRRQDDVERREPVAGDDEHLVGRVLVHVAHLAPADELPGGSRWTRTASS